MPYTLQSSTNCNRGQLTTILNGLLGNRAYVITNNSQSSTQVQYWGTYFEDLDDTLVTTIPVELIQSKQLYRQNTRFSTIGYGGSNVGVARIWIPRNYLFSFAIINLYLVS